MGWKRDYIENLIIEEIHGTITPQQREDLLSAISSDRELQTLRERLYSLHDAEYEAGKKRFDEAVTAKKILGRAKRQIRIVRMRQAAAIAACAVGVCIGSYFLFHQSGSAPTSDIAVAAPGSVHLQLASGDVVDLSKDQQVAAGGMNLHTKGKTLTYQAATSAPQWATLSVPAGKDFILNLADGSRVQLNATTTVRFPSSFSGRREVYIEGEAYLQVAKSGLPFIVHLNETTVEVLGTEFNVNTYKPGQSRIALVAGAVKVVQGHESLLVKPGKEAIATNRGIVEEPFETDDLLAWRDGLYVFQSSTVEEMKEVIGRLYAIRVTLDDPAVGTIRYRGVMDRKKPISIFLKNMEYGGVIQYQFDKDSVLHLSSPKN